MQPPRFWYPKRRGPAPLLARALWPAAVLYDLGATIRRKTSDPRRAGVPVICVGNLTLGGTGKTPIVIALAEELLKMGKKPIILSRGYGGRLDGPVKVDLEIHTARDVGDEPLLLARAAPVIVCANRAVGAVFAAREDTDVILMDDGFQNPTIHKDYSIVVVDGQRFVGNGRVFPAGPLRENTNAGLARADLVVIMGGDPTHPLPEFLENFSGPILRAVLEPQVAKEAFNGKKVLAFAGIGSPEKFFRTVRDLGARVMGEVAFPDHYKYRSADIRSLKKRATELMAIPVTTEKDAVRLPLAGKGITTIPVKPVFAEHAKLEDLLESWMEQGIKEKILIRVSDEKRQAKPQHYVEAAAFYAIMGLFRVLGMERASAFGGWLGRTIGPRVPPANRARRNLELAMPELSETEREEIVVKMFDNLGRTAGEYAHLDKFVTKGDGVHVDVVGGEKFKRVVEEGKGGILISGHFANWELMPLALRSVGGSGAGIYRAPNNPFIDDWLIKTRANNFLPILIPKGAEGGRAILKIIRAGQMVGMLVDQKMNEGIPVPFFGHEAMTPPAAAALALRYKVPIIPISMERLGGTQFRVTVHEPPALATTGDMNVDIYNLTLWLNEYLEKIIRKRPEQWLWLHQRWGKYKNGVLETRKTNDEAA